jgi:hypothetical protein
MWGYTKEMLTNSTILLLSVLEIFHSKTFFKITITKQPIHSTFPQYSLYSTVESSRQLHNGSESVTSCHRGGHIRDEDTF